MLPRSLFTAERRAYHESGHIVACCALQGTVYSVSRRGGGAGFGQALYSLPDWPAPPASPTMQAAGKIITTCWAGPVAEQLQTGIICGSKGDRKDIDAARERVGMSEDEATSLLAAAAHILTTFWREVDQIAQALMAAETGELAGEQVHRLFDQSRTMPRLRPPFQHTHLLKRPA